MKKKNVRGNQMPFIAKELSKEIMARSRLRNNDLIDKTGENRFLYTQKKELLWKFRRGGSDWLEDCKPLPF